MAQAKFKVGDKVMVMEKGLGRKDDRIASKVLTIKGILMADNQETEYATDAVDPGLLKESDLTQFLSEPKFRIGDKVTTSVGHEGIVKYIWIEQDAGRAEYLYDVEQVGGLKIKLYEADLELANEKLSAKFKIGDKVRVLDGSKIEDYSGGWASEGMNKYVGKICTIKDVRKDFQDEVQYALNCEGIIEHIDYGFDERGLELVAEKPTPKFAVGDKVRIVKLGLGIKDKSLIGKTFEIKSAKVLSSGKEVYRLKDAPYLWTAELLEPHVDDSSPAKFKVGDKVKVIDASGISGLDRYECDRSLIGNTYTIRGYAKYSGDPHTFYTIEENLITTLYEEELVPTSRKIVITTDGKTTLARLYDGKKVVKTAEAHCSPDDKFDFSVGAKLAMERLTGVDERPGAVQVYR